ncbi:MAG: hypothetical protein GXY92_04825 [Syntrophomonadaceae bacterium]|nr:hypothetical protein [Syntrophomonadaceae bacterium]
MRSSNVLVILCFLFSIFLTGCSQEKAVTNITPLEYKTIDDLAQATIVPYLSQELWIKRDIYDAGHRLMVPLHYAFANDDNKLIQSFEDHFTRFLNEGLSKVDITIDSQRLDTLQYYYVLSRYLVLADKNNSYNFDSAVHEELKNHLIADIEKIWLRIPAWQWDREHFENGMKERLDWKLDNLDTEKSYYRAIIDEELFTLAIAADLSILEPDNSVLREINKYAFKVLQREGKFDEEGKWLFQVGVWDDHPDYAYAGYTSKEKVTGTKPIVGIAADSSHFHRFPLWINSFIQATEEGTEENRLFKNILEGLEKQFFNNVLIPPNDDVPYYRLTNYMDGYNGLYRWNYATMPNDGYGPYELSGTFSLGWWTFLGSERIKHVYKDLYNQYPLTDEVIKLYVGPNTTRERNPLVKEPDVYFNGFNELITYYASEVK